MYAVICGVMTRLGVNIPAANNANPVGECKIGRDGLRVVHELIRCDTRMKKCRMNLYPKMSTSVQ
jgi:hypothetical protein